jgi:hypothetical protein
MCYEYELEYQLRRAEEARKEARKTEEQEKLKPEETPQSPGGREEPVPV